MVSFSSNNYDFEPKESEEDDPIKDIAKGFRGVGKKAQPIGNKLSNIINNVILSPASGRKLFQKLEKHLAPGKLNSLKIKKM